MSTVSCPTCGHPNADTAKFCAKCGNKLTPAETLVMGSANLYDTPPPMPIPAQHPASPAPPVAPAPSAKEQAAYNPLPPMPPPQPSSYSPPAYSPPAYAPVAPPAAGAAAPSAAPGAHSYVAMHTIAGLCNVLAWVSLVLGVLGGLFWAYLLLGGVGLTMLFIGLIGGAIFGALGWIYWRLLGEGIWLALEIASNTRRTAAALENQRRP